MNCCPTCGHVLRDIGLRVDLPNNTIIYGGDRIVHLRPRHAEIMTILIKASPNYVKTFDLLDKLEGIWSAELSSGTLKVHILNLRKRLAHTPIRVNTKWGMGYNVVVADAETLAAE